MTIPVGSVDFGDLNRPEPFSTEWGYDRGQPIDRLYIEEFLQTHSADVRGRVIEVGDATYTLRFGAERVSQSDVLHVKPGSPQATVIANLADADHIPSAIFDCIILTQTLHLIFDVRAAVKTLYRILAPGGVLLLTVPGISQIDHSEWNENWYWSITVQGLNRLLKEHFSESQTDVKSRGNVLAAAAFLYGLSQDDLPSLASLADDPHYPLTVLARAVKS